jgi:hypothetical protein
MCGLVVGCAVNSPNTGTPNGTLSGQALEYGGPLVNGTQAATGIPGHGILITIERGGRSVASSTTASDGRFSFSLPAGMYKITGCIPVTGDVHAGQQAVQDLSCPIK